MTAARGHEDLSRVIITFGHNQIKCYTRYNNRFFDSSPALEIVFRAEVLEIHIFFALIVVPFEVYTLDFAGTSLKLQYFSILSVICNEIHWSHRGSHLWLKTSCSGNFFSHVGPVTVRGRISNFNLKLVQTEVSEWSSMALENSYGNQRQWFEKRIPMAGSHLIWPS